MRYFINFFFCVFLTITISFVCYAEYGIMRDRTPHPIIPLASYKIVDPLIISTNPREYTWTQLHLEVYYYGLEEGTGYQRLKCAEKNGEEMDNLVFIITDATQTNEEFLKSLCPGDLLDLYCMVESTLVSGKTVVMIEKIYSKAREFQK